MSIGLAEGEYALKLGAYRQAFEIFLMLATGDEDPAYYKLCEMVLNGQLGEEELKTLEEHLQRAAKDGNKMAIYNLGFLRWHAKGIMKDIPKAVELFQEACAEDVAEAFVALARLYMGDAKEHPLATGPNIINLLEQGLGRGSIDAAYLLGKAHYEGIHAKRNDSDAFKYLFVAGRLGHVEAKKALMVLQAIHPNNRFTSEQEDAKLLIDRIELEHGGFR